MLPIYLFFNFFNYKYIVIVFILGVFIGYNGHIKERFHDMFQTIINLNQDKNLGDLNTLSTNNRIHIYKNYLDLVKKTQYHQHEIKIVNIDYVH